MVGALGALLRLRSACPFRPRTRGYPLGRLINKFVNENIAMSQFRAGDRAVPSPRRASEPKAEPPIVPSANGVDPVNLVRQPDFVM